jgi:hypothetical protein
MPSITNRTLLVWIMKGTHIPSDNLFQQTDLEANLYTLIPHMYILNRLLPWLGTGTSIKCGGVKLALWDQTS